MIEFRLNGVGLVSVSDTDEVTVAGAPASTQVRAAALYIARLVRSGTHEIVDSQVREKA